MSIKRTFSQILLAMGAYVVVSTILTFYNKNILTALGFRFEVTMVLFQAISNSIFAGSYCYAFLRHSPSITSCAYWPNRITWKLFATQLFPLGALFGFDITLTNLSFRLSSVAVTEVVKSGIPALVLLFGVVVKQETMTQRKLVVVLVLCCGILLTTAGDFSPQLGAILAAIGATFCGAAKLVLTQRLLTARDHLHPTLSLMYMMLSSIVALIVPFVMFEASDLFTSQWLTSACILSTFKMLFIGSTIAFMLNMTILIVIKWSSALSLCVAGVVKLLLTIVISALLFDFKLTKLNVVGSLLAVFGVIAFNWITYQDTRLAIQYAKLDYDLNEFTNVELSPVTQHEQDTIRM